MPAGRRRPSPHPPPSLEVRLPAWAVRLQRAAPACLPALEERMALVLEAARRNVARGTGGPFAAAVFERDSGRLVSLGVNLVLSGGLSLLHAEMVALALAQCRTGSYDLGAEGLADHELVASAEPCAMCLGAIPWSGVRRVVTGARDADARAIGFDEGEKPRAWRRALARRGIATVRDVGRAAAVEVLREYARLGGPIYNSRGAAPPSPARV